MPGLTDSVRAEAARLGFDRVGFAGLGPARTGREYLAWLARGEQAGMDYMTRNRGLRLDPRGLLPGARSAVVVAVPYDPGSDAAPADPHRYAPVARYARGRDYHRVLRRSLGRLSDRIREIAGSAAVTRVCVDTAPLLERDLAVAAGLGWFGRHTGVLHPQHGNWFFLGSVLTDLELDPDEPVADRCGTCRACVDACPTGALRDDRRLDAGLCVSYLTIEHRGAIPRDLRVAIGVRVFGCDDCLAACPWNRFASVPSDPAWAPRAERTWVDPVDWLADPDRLETAVRGSALRRAGRDGLLRNAAVAAGNHGDPRAVPALIDRLRNDPAAVVRSHAAWALGRIRGASARAALAAARVVEPDPDVQLEIDHAVEDAGRRA